MEVGQSKLKEKQRVYHWMTVYNTVNMQQTTFYQKNFTTKIRAEGRAADLHKHAS